MKDSTTLQVLNLILLLWWHLILRLGSIVSKQLNIRTIGLSKHFFLRSQFFSVASQAGSSVCCFILANGSWCNDSHLRHIVWIVPIIVTHIVLERCDVKLYFWD